MKPTSGKSEGSKLIYQLKNGWRLKRHQIEHPKGISQTVPDQSYHIRDLITKYAGGVDPGVSKLPNYNGEDTDVDFDDLDMGSITRAEIHEQDEVKKQTAARQKLLLEQMEESNKKPLVEKAEVGEIDDDLSEAREEENTPKRRTPTSGKKDSSREGNPTKI